MTTAPPNLPIPARLILAIILSVSVHSLLLLGWGRYHAGVGVSHFPFENAGVLRVRIVNLAPDETPTLSQAPPAQETTRAVLSVPATTGGASPLPAASPDKATAPAPPLQETYYRTGDLDVKPQIKVRVMPVYPETAVLQNIGGRVVIRVFISETGTVDDVEVVNANPPGMFDDSAITAFRAARFFPGMKGHKAVKSLMTLEVNYGNGSADQQDALTGAR